MATSSKSTLSEATSKEVLEALQTRFEKSKSRFKQLGWPVVADCLTKHPTALKTLFEMERTGGMPELIEWDTRNKQFIFCDCAPESPEGRRSLCYDRDAWESRKENKPAFHAVGMAQEMGIELPDELAYRKLQELGKFDQKTSSWIKTPESIRKLGGALFADLRYGQVFIYHNSAPSYYAARGFRGLLRVPF